VLAGGPSQLHLLQLLLLPESATGHWCVLACVDVSAAQVADGEQNFTIKQYENGVVSAAAQLCLLM
jgi:hypothetical protein